MTAGSEILMEAPTGGYTLAKCGLGGLSCDQPEELDHALYL
jgi:hypothetical protein